MSEPKQYVGKGWLKEFQNGGHVLNISIKVGELPLPDEYGNVNLTVGKRREPDEKTKATHWVAIDTYRRKKEEGKAVPPPPADDSSTLPF